MNRNVLIALGAVIGVLLVVVLVLLLLSIGTSSGGEVTTGPTEVVTIP